MALTSDQCRQKANECREMARKVPKESHRIMLNHMAETWDRLAAEVEKHDGHG